MKIKLSCYSVLLIASIGILFGFDLGDEIYGSKSAPDNSHYSSIEYPPKSTSVYIDDFNGDNSIAGLNARGYKTINHSTPVGSTGWFQGSVQFVAYNGPAAGYVAANFNNTTGGSGVIDNWLIFPRISGGIQVGDSLTFWSRSNVTTGTNYPDSIRVYYSASGDSTVTGAWVELGRFRVINPVAGAANNGYEKRGFVAPSNGANGRFAIIYHVNNAGPTGTNSDFIGVDAARIERTIAPPPNPTTWYEINTPVTGILYSISAPDINNVWASGAAGKVIKTINGATFTSASGNLPASDIIYSIWAFDENNCLCSTTPSSTIAWKTTNGGTNWNQVFNQAGGFIDGFYFKDVSNGLMVGNSVGGRSSIWKTTNGGTSWDSAGINFSSTAAGWVNSISGNGNVVYWGTNNSKLYKSTNFGTTWTSTSATGESDSYAVYFNDASNGMIGGNTLLQSTTNSGTNWNTVTPPGTVNTIFGITGTGTANYWVTRAGNIYQTTNTGASWTNPVISGSGIFQHITKSRTGSPYLYACRSNGTIAKYGGPSVGITSISEIADQFSLSQNYPNPFNPVTKITFAVPVSGLVTLKVFDMTGKEIATLVNAQMNNGNYSVDFNAANLSSGIYLYTIKSGNFTDTKKMMLVK